MSRRNNAHLRCKRCRLHESLCFCTLIPRLETRTSVILVIHRAEDRKSTNTGRLATLCLPNSRTVLRGQKEASCDLGIDSGTQPLLLFPHEDAVDVRRYAPSENAASEKPITLIVPDGTWRQASKVRNRVPGLAEIPCVTIPHDEPSAYRLRSEAHATGLATLEAIARALGALEGMEIRRSLERTLRTMVDRTLWARGELPASRVEGGIPEGVMRHDPRSGSRGESGSLA